MKRKNHNTIMNKIRSTAGESIAETLVALLIAALALTMLAGSVAAASHMVTTSRQKLDSYYDATEDMVNGDGTASNLNVIIKRDGKTVLNKPVNAYTNDVFGAGKTVMVYRLNNSN